MMRWLLFICITVCPLPAFGQAICNTPQLEAEHIVAEGYSETLLALISVGCFQDNAIVPQKEINKLLPDTENEEERVVNLIKGLTYLQDFADTQLQTTQTEQQAWANIKSGASSLKIGAEAAKDSGSESAIKQVANDLFGTDEWRIRQQGNDVGMAPIVGSLSAGIDAQCPAERPADCPAYLERKKVAYAVQAGQRIVFYSGAGTELVQLADSRISTRKWNAYFNDAQFQWWWEVAINGRRMVNKNMCDQDLDTPGKQGFCTVPSDQLIFMHPDVALHWVDGANESSELKGAFVIKVIGKNSWHWNADGSIFGAKGLSLIAAYTDLNNSDNWGYGLMYDHQNRFSIGIISTDGELGAILTVDLAKYVFERKKKYMDFMAATEKPEFWKDVLFAN